MAPSLNITQEDVHTPHDATQLLKEKVFDLIFYGGYLN
jgi:hypothetical protein